MSWPAVFSSSVSNVELLGLFLSLKALRISSFLRFFCPFNISFRQICHIVGVWMGLFGCGANGYWSERGRRGIHILLFGVYSKSSLFNLNAKALLSKGLGEGKVRKLIGRTMC